MKREKNLYLPQSGLTAQNDAVPVFGDAPCPCCGSITIPNGGDALAYICPVCLWEVDLFIRSEDEPSDQNHGLTLIQCRENYRSCGAVLPRLVKHSRPARKDELPLSWLPPKLLPWFDKNKRDLPWRRDRDPYHVWLSEIMLQQTRVEAVKGYYARFLEALPSVQALADCDEEQLLKLWEGLGYYNRARNLQKAAKMVAEIGFPDTYEGLLALPGVGEYTAGAVASICFDRPVAAVDGNVLRVISRYLADPAPITEPAVKKQVKAALEAVYPAERPGDFTQALMELGATVCVPNGPPKCEICPLNGQCRAFLERKTARFPVKADKKARKEQKRTVFLLRCGNKLALEKRPAKGLLAGLWQLPNVEGELSTEQAIRQAADWGCEPHDLRTQRRKKHIFTHITWEMEGFELTCGREDPRFVWAAPEQLEQEYALPTAFRQFLEE